MRTSRGVCCLLAPASADTKTMVGYFAARSSFIRPLTRPNVTNVPVITLTMARITWVAVGTSGGCPNGPLNDAAVTRIPASRVQRATRLNCFAANPVSSPASTAATSVAATILSGPRLTGWPCGVGQTWNGTPSKPVTLTRSTLHAAAATPQTNPARTLERIRRSGRGSRGSGRATDRPKVTAQLPKNGDHNVDNCKSADPTPDGVADCSLLAIHQDQNENCD